MSYPNSARLRHGRVSITGQCYLVTFTTRNRYPWFLDHGAAATAARLLYSPVIARRADTLAYVIMPDHIHWLFQLDGQLAEAVRVYKASVSMALGYSVWQSGFHDHAVRDAGALVRLARYIVANPLRAGLVDNIGQYPYWNAPGFKNLCYLCQSRQACGLHRPMNWAPTI